MCAKLKKWKIIWIVVSIILQLSYKNVFCCSIILYLAPKYGNTDTTLWSYLSFKWESIWENVDILGVMLLSLYGVHILIFNAKAGLASKLLHKLANSRVCIEYWPSLEQIFYLITESKCLSISKKSTTQYKSCA